MAEGFVARGGKACGELHCSTSHEEIGNSNLWFPISFGLGGSNRVQAQPARPTKNPEALIYG